MVAAWILTLLALGRHILAGVGDEVGELEGAAEVGAKVIGDIVGELVVGAGDGPYIPRETCRQSVAEMGERQNLSSSRTKNR